MSGTIYVEHKKCLKTEEIPKALTNTFDKLCDKYGVKVYISYSENSYCVSYGFGFETDKIKICDRCKKLHDCKGIKSFTLFFHIRQIPITY